MFVMDRRFLETGLHWCDWRKRCPICEDKKKTPVKIAGQPVCEVCGELVKYKIIFWSSPGATQCESLPPHVCDPNQAMWEKWARAFVKYDKLCDAGGVLRPRSGGP